MNKYKYNPIWVFKCISCYYISYLALENFHHREKHTEEEQDEFVTYKLKATLLFCAILDQSGVVTKVPLWGRCASSQFCQEALVFGASFDGVSSLHPSCSERLLMYSL